MLYSLKTVAFTEKAFSKLDVVFRSMLRKVIGWKMSADSSWEERGREMKIRLDHVVSKFKLAAWSKQVQKRQRDIMKRMSDGKLPKLTEKAILWQPPACQHLNAPGVRRKRGRPRTRWYDRYAFEYVRD